MNERYIACFLLHALGDTIGYKNGEWEFNYSRSTVNYNIANEILSDFIHLGGINCIVLKGWKVSDDTILHMKVCKSLLTDHKDINEYGFILKKNLIDGLDLMLENDIEERSPGEITIKAIQRLDTSEKWNDEKYDFKKGGSGASMRCSCIGLAFHNDFNNLIKYSIESSRITHNSTVGYLGGFVAALFTAYAIKGIDVKQWGLKLMKILDSSVLDDYIMKSGRGYENHLSDSSSFIGKWKHYINDKFDETGKPIMRKTMRNISYRGKYYYENYGYTRGAFFPGSGGDDSVIIAYDCLLDAGNCWEKLVIYSMLHVGDTDTTGAIAASWFGALYGFKNVPKKNLKHLEFKSELINLGKKMYNKFYK